MTDAAASWPVCGRQPPCPHAEGAGAGIARGRPLLGCLAFWGSVLCLVTAVGAVCLGKWMIAGTSLVGAILLWFLKGKPNPDMMAEFSERYDLDGTTGGKGTDEKGPKG